MGHDTHGDFHRQNDIVEIRDEMGEIRADPSVVNGRLSRVEEMLDLPEP